MKIAFWSYVLAHPRSKNGLVLWASLWLAVMGAFCGGCSTSSGQATKIPAKDRAMVVLYLESKQESMPITAVYYRHAEHKAGNRTMKLIKHGKGVACWSANVPPGSFLVSGVDCTFLGNQELMGVGAGNLMAGPRSVVTRQLRFAIASTTVSEPAVYYLGSYMLDPGVAREGGHLYASTTVTALAEPPELSILLKLAEKTEGGQWQNVVNQRIEQIRAYQKSKTSQK